MFIRAIIWTLIFLLAYRAIKFILRIMSGSSSQKPDIGSKNKYPSNLKINKEDIIEADFEEIKDSENDNPK